MVCKKIGYCNTGEPMTALLTRNSCLQILSVLLLLCGSIAAGRTRDGVSKEDNGGGGGGVGLGVEVESSEVPQGCNSPGWRETPRDIALLPGRHIFMNCRSAITHTRVVWVLDGMVDITTTPFANRVRLFNGNHSVRLGPLEAEDEEMVLGCRVHALNYGILPSPLATITVLTPPQFSAPRLNIAVVGRPFEIHMQFSGVLHRGRQPTYLWMKDGMLFAGDGDRVTVELDRITFTEVRAGDSGRYTVRARNRAGEGIAHTDLKVLPWPSSDMGSFDSISPHLALLIALSHSHTSNTTSSSFPRPTIDRLGVMAVIRRLLYQATPEALQQGSARLRLEDLLERMQLLTGGQNMSSSDLDTLNRAINCNASLPTYDCTSYKILRYRTYDGTCNNFFYPLFGAALTPFPRILPAEYEDGISAPVGRSQALAGGHTSPPWPSARHISWNVIRSNATSLGGSEEEGVAVFGAGITHMVMQWGQFLDHDLDLSPVFDEECGCEHTRKCFPIDVGENDTTFGTRSSNDGHCLTFSRSLPTCRLESLASVPRDQVNQITSFIDGSQVYGSSEKLAMSLRTRVGGLLKQGGRYEADKGNLPFQKERPEGGVLPFFIAGDERANEQTGLTVMHTLWLREHNRIARRLGKMNPCWDDERIYQVARKIVGAEMQKITYYDFLPVLFGSHMQTYIPMYRGYNPFINPALPNSFAAAAYRFGHSLIRNQLLRLTENYTALDIGHLYLARAFFNPVSYFESMGTDPIARGLMMDVANPVDEFLNSVLTSQLFPKTPESLGGDLASLNIQRGRDHGIPSYRTWQRYCEEKFPAYRVSFRDNATIALLQWIYGPEEGFRNGMDLWVAGLAEERMEGAQLGPTFACILGLSFSRLRDGDRFWFETDYELSDMQKRAVKQTSLGRVVCDNSDNIGRVSRNVFVSGMVRVDCEDIPQLDLQLWKDYSCRERKPYSYRP